MKKILIPLKGIIALLIGLAFSSVAFAQEPTFSDLESDDSHFVPVEILVYQGALKGYPDKTFRTENRSNRAELLKTVVASQGIHPDPSIYKNCFIDVLNEWFAPYVCYAKEKGWVEGYRETEEFRPASKASDQEALKIMLNSFFSKEIQAQSEKVLEDLPYNLNSQYWRYIYFALSHNLIDDKEGDFSERGQMADIVMRSKLMQLEEWEVYHPYLRDEFLEKNSLNELLESSSSCHPLVWEIESLFDVYSTPMSLSFFEEYIASEHGITQPYLSYLQKKDKPFPHFNAGFICGMKGDDMLFINSIDKEDKQEEYHLMRFNGAGELTEDTSVSCPFYDGNIIDLPLEDLNADSFEIMDCNFAKDKNKVWFLGWQGAREIEGGNPNTFKVLSEYHSVDDQNAYFGTSLIEEASVDSFEVIKEPDMSNNEHLYARDDQFVYHFGGIIENADPKSFMQMDAGYSKDEKSVYYDSDLFGFTELGGVDVETFEILEGDLYHRNIFSRDRNSIYFHGEIPRVELSSSSEIYSYHAPSFEFLQVDNHSNGAYVKDENGIYFIRVHWATPPDSSITHYTHHKLQDADPETFQEVGYSKYYKDDQFVYNQEKKLVQYDASSFMVLSQLYTLDENAVYYKDEKVNGADPNYFEQLGDSEYFKDLKNVYFRGEILQGADVNNFEILTIYENLSNFDVLARDKTHIYSRGIPVETQVLDVQTAQIKNEVDLGSTSRVRNWLIEDQNGYQCDIEVGNLERTECE